MRSRLLEPADRQGAKKQRLLTRQRRSETQGSARGRLCMEPLGNREMTSLRGVPQDCVIVSLTVSSLRTSAEERDHGELPSFPEYHTCVHAGRGAGLGPAEIGYL